MYSTYQTSYLEVPDSLSLEEMMECDIREMDMNFNDPLFTEQSIFTSPDAQRVLKQERRIDCISPGDLTNLQWLQNVSIPMEKNANGQDKSVMVDPNTVMPVQWQNHQQQQQQPSTIPVTIPQSLTQQTQLNVQPRNDQKHRAQDSKLTKDNNKTNEKAYPKPLFSYSCLIAMALQNSDAGTLPVSEIYKFMMGKFPYFKTAPDGWKNSVRHNLSLNKAFCKLERPQGASQRKGCLWSLRPERKEQMEKEIKKWKKKHAEAIRASMAHPEELQISTEDLEESLTAHHNHIEDVAAADAAKELFGNNLIQEIQQHEELDWDDIISSGTDLNLAPTLTNSTMGPSISALNIQTAPVTTTVELDNSAQYFINGHDFDNTSYVSNYYNLQPQQMAHLSTGF
ncbi:hypothetical protein QZH41_012405 [Actinostola sp. cb2023]|nr:hypothetical protein QZH41_012405 [Actinostola sp. cb2023]